MRWTLCNFPRAGLVNLADGPGNVDHAHDTALEVYSPGTFHLVTEQVF